MAGPRAGGGVPPGGDGAGGDGEMAAWAGRLSHELAGAVGRALEGIREAGIAFSGGKGNFVGAVIGGIILGLLINIIYFANITSFYQVFTKGAIILVALLIGAVPRLRRELSHR